MSRYVRKVEAGKRIAVTAHGRVIAELIPPGRSHAAARQRYDVLVATGVIEPATSPDSTLAEWPHIKAPTGTVAQLIEADRDER